MRLPATEQLLYGAREENRTPDLRITRPSRVVPGRPIVSRHVPQNSSATTGFGRLLEHGGTEWETVRHSCWHGCWHDNPSAMSAGRSMQPSDGCRCALFVGPDGSHRPYAVGIWPQATAPDGLVVLPRRSGNFSTPSRQRSWTGVRGLPRQRSTSRVRGQVHWHSQTQNHAGSERRHSDRATSFCTGYSHASRLPYPSFWREGITPEWLFGVLVMRRRCGTLVVRQQRPRSPAGP